MTTVQTKKELEIKWWQIMILGMGLSIFHFPLAEYITLVGLFLGVWEAFKYLTHRKK